jgi:methyl-accepting chemotaxis protein
MQQTLSAHISEMEQLSDTLRERAEKLRVAYNHAQEADRMKTAFLHNMTNQMLEPSESICQDVETLCNPDKKGEQKDTSKLANDIQQNGTTIAELLKNLINMSDEDMRKEVQDA